MWPWNHPAIHTDTKLGQDLREESGEFWEAWENDNGTIEWHPVGTHRCIIGNCMRLTFGNDYCEFHRQGR